jgi:hypothetical protein
MSAFVSTSSHGQDRPKSSYYIRVCVSILFVISLISMEAESFCTAPSKHFLELNPTVPIRIVLSLAFDRTTCLKDP